MAQTLLRQAVNTVETSVTGGSIPDANKIIEVADWIDRLAPYDTPLLTSVGYGKAIDQDVYYWGQSYQTPLEGVLGEDLDNVETGVDVATGTGERFWPWCVIAVTDYDVNGYLDHSTTEIMVVSSISNDTLTVARGEGGTSAVTHTGTGANPAHVDIIGTALPQNTDFELSPITRGDQAYNYFERLYGMVQADQAARNQPTYENPTDVLLADAEETGKQLKILLEKAMYRGGRQRGVIGTPTATLMGGLDTFITSNVTDVGGANLSVYSLESELRDQWKTVGADNIATKFLMGPDTAAIFDTTLNPYREADMSDTSANFVFDKIRFRWGTYDLMVSRHCPEGLIYGIRPEYISVHPFKGCNWQIMDVPTEGPYQKRAVWGDFSLCVKGEATMFKLHGFNSNFDSYPRNEYF